MSQPTLAQLGAVIRELRKQRSLTIEALADQAGMHAVSISRIEAGDQNVTWTHLGSIATTLGVEVLELVRMASDADPDRAAS